MKLFRFYAIALLALPLLFSCAKEESVSNDTIEKELLEAYMHVTYGEDRSAWPAKADMGYYYLPLRTTGNTKYAVDDWWVRYDISFKKQDGTLIYANTENVARAYNEFSYSRRYAPSYYIIGENYGYITKGGADAMRRYAAVGDSIRLIIPPSMAGIYLPPEYIINYASKPVIIDIAVREVNLLPKETEQAELLAYKKANFPAAVLLKGESGKDTTDIYFQELTSPTEDIAVESGDTVLVLYAGQYLDGFMFDTNIADSAKNHHIYTYDPTKYMAEGMQVIIGNDEVVSGFEAAIKNMKKGSSAAVMFTSEWGYGNMGKDNGGPNYTSTLFHIWLLDVKKAETDNEEGG